MLEGYLDILAAANHLPRGRWRFEPGMLFGSDIKWWADGDRDVPHNGLDIGVFSPEDGAQSQITLDGSSVVPAAGDGEIINIIKDFLGHSIFISHGIGQDGSIIISAYGHLAPSGKLSPGVQVKRGDVIGSLAQYAGMPVPPHLHLSIIRAAISSVMGEMEDFSDFSSWQRLESSEDAVFIDPMLKIR